LANWFKSTSVNRRPVSDALSVSVAGMVMLTLKGWTPIVPAMPKGMSAPLKRRPKVSLAPCDSNLKYALGAESPGFLKSIASTYMAPIGVVVAGSPGYKVTSISPTMTRMGSSCRTSIWNDSVASVLVEEIWASN